MRGRWYFLLAIAGYFLLVPLAGSLLAWPVFLLLQTLGVDGPPFHKLTLRVVQLCALFALWPLARILGLVPRDAFALVRGERFWRELGNGMLMGLAGLAVLALALLLLGVRVPRPDLVFSPGRTAAFVLVAAVGALLLAMIEEVWFRGGLHGIGRRFLGVAGAAVAGSVVFALVHYARADQPVAAHEVSWHSGLQVMAGAFDRLTQQAVVIDSLVALFLLGLMLVALRERSGRLALPIGVHAGSVMVIRLLREYTEVNHASPLAFLVGSYDGVVGWLAAGWMLLLIAVIVLSRKLPGATAPPM